jgi:hypothetical protein
MDLPKCLPVQARANRLANRRLHAAMAPLTLGWTERATFGPAAPTAD